MSLIERYIQEVKKNLPESQKAEVESELRKRIERMMQEKGGYSEKAQGEVIEELGNPRLLAEEYRVSKRFLIGPEIYGTYEKVLKIVVTVAVAGTIVGNTVDFIVNEKSFLSYLAATVGTALSAAIGAFGWLTLIFAIIERKAKDKFLRELREDWSIKDLPQEEKPEKAFSKVGIAIGVFFTILLMILVSGYSHLLGVYYDVEGAREFIPILNADAFSTYIPYIVGMLAIQLVLSLSKLIFKTWNYYVATANLIVNILSLALLVFMLRDSSIINSELAIKVSEATGKTANIVSIIKKPVIAAFSLIFAFDSIEGFYEAYKNARRQAS